MIDAEENKFSEITIPASTKTIGQFVFCQNDIITKVVIPNGVTKICYGAFSECMNLMSVTIPDSVVEFEDGIFDYSDNVRITYKGKNYTVEEFDNMRGK